MPKENRIYMRFDDEEMERLTEKAQGKPLATFCSEICLGTRKRRKKRETQYSDISPEAMKALSAIGNNLNQIARLGHAAKKDNVLELTALIEAIEAVKKQAEDLANVSENFRQQEIDESIIMP